MGAFVIAQQLLRGGAVAATIDATYTEAWLVDGSPGTPIQRTGNLSAVITPPSSQMMDVFALVNHTVDVSAGVSGDASATIPAGALDGEGIRFNPFVRLATPVSVSASLTLTVSGNAAPVIIGEFYGGLGVEFEAYELDLDPGDPFEWEGEFSSIPPYDSGLSSPRRLAGDVVMTAAQLAQVKAVYASTRRGSRPCLVIPDTDVNDAWCARFRFRAAYEDTIYRVALEVIEIPRTRW